MNQQKSKSSRKNHQHSIRKSALEEVEEKVKGKEEEEEEEETNFAVPAPQKPEKSEEPSPKTRFVRKTNFLI